MTAARRVRLWLSYQRYGIVLTLGSLATIALAAWLAPWWLAVAVGLVALWPIGFGVIVLRRWPRKLRATLVAEHRLAAGRFRPAQVRPYCGDPCFRVVAGEILGRAGTAPAERRALIAAYRAELERERDIVVMIDHSRGVIVTVEQGRVTEQLLGPPREPGPIAVH